MKLSILTAAAAAATLASFPAGAQTASGATHATGEYVEKNVGGDAVVTFVGDELAAPPGGAYGDTVRRPPGVTRLGLIRPRMNFVVELVKTVENL